VIGGPTTKKTRAKKAKVDNSESVTKPEKKKDHGWGKAEERQIRESEGLVTFCKF
jgi:hypothetical protein